MSPYHKKQKEKKRKNLYRKWHRRVGFSAALFLINLAITGILLNHSEDLELHNHYVESPWLINWYGIEAPKELTCFTLLSTSPLCQLGDKLYYNNQQIHSNLNELVGVAESNQLIYAATVDHLHIYTQSFDLVESIDSELGLPTPVSSLFTTQQSNSESDSDVHSIVISSNQEFWMLNEETLSWQSLERDEPVEKSEVDISEDRRKAIEKLYLSKQISYLKVIQDLHSGRILSIGGKIITDIVAIVIILLAFSGFFAWQKRNKSNKH